MAMLLLLKGMCPAKKQDDGLERSSSIEELSDPIADLFEVLTSEPDPLSRWTAYTYPAHLDLLYFNPANVPLDPQLTDIGNESRACVGLSRYGAYETPQEGVNSPYRDTTVHSCASFTSDMKQLKQGQTLTLDVRRSRSRAQGQDICSNRQHLFDASDVLPSLSYLLICLQCFDTDGWASGRAPGL